MCLGMPMQVLHSRPGRASVRGRGETREVGTALVGDVQPGDWLLIFLDDARERLSAERAAEVDATLDLVLAAMRGADGTPGSADPGFVLPSAMSAEQLAALAGAAR